MEDLEHKLYSLQDADALSHARCPFLSSLSPSGRPAPAPRNAVRLDAPPLAAYGVEGARGEGPLERESGRAVRDTLEMESAWRSPAPPWAREKRERRRAEPDAAAAGLCGALALWELAERAPVGPAGGRVESEWERFLSLGFKCRCGEGEREGGGEGVRGASGQRRGASRRTVGGSASEVAERR